MFDFGAIEILLIVVVAVVVIGPKDMPLALRHAGRWIGKVRKLSGQFRSGLNSMVREAELEDMEKKWASQNAKIMANNPSAEKAAEAAKKADDEPESVMTEKAKPAPEAATAQNAVPKGSEPPAETADKA